MATKPEYAVDRKAGRGRASRNKHPGMLFAFALSELENRAQASKKCPKRCLLSHKFDNFARYP